MAADGASIEIDVLVRLRRIKAARPAWLVLAAMPRPSAWIGYEQITGTDRADLADKLEQLLTGDCRDQDVLDATA